MFFIFNLRTDFDVEITEPVKELFKEYDKGSQFKNNLNIEAFRRYLKNSKDPNINIKFIEDGFPLYLITDGTKFKPINLSQKRASFANNKKEFLKIVKQFTKELKSGAIVPSETPPLHIINVFCVPKKDSETGQMTKLRVVRHGSFATTNTTSINDWIDPNKCKMPTLPNLKDYVKLLINSNWMTLRDLSDAFRQIGLASKDEGYLGYSMFGKYFIDKKQPYGIASAAANCQSFAQIIIWIMENQLLPESLCKRILVHIDDFCLAGETKKETETMTQTFDALCNELNVKISHEKDVNVTQEAVLYGFLFNLKKKTVGIPNDKLRELKRLTINTIITGQITGRALESLCGKIMHWSQLYKPAKALCYNMVSYLHKLLRAQSNYKMKVYPIPECIRNDLIFWLKYMDLIKEVSMESIIRPPSIVVMGTSDACDFGAGFCVNDEWGFYKFRDPQIGWHINQKEAHAVIMLLHNMKEQLTGKQLVLLVDNTSLFYSMAKHWGSELMMPCVYEICYLLMEYKIQIWFEWIPTEVNKLADSLSRYDFDCFWKWVRLHDLTIKPKPLPITYFANLTYKGLF